MCWPLFSFLGGQICLEAHKYTLLVLASPARVVDVSFVYPLGFVFVVSVDILSRFLLFHMLGISLSLKLVGVYSKLSL